MSIILLLCRVVSRYEITKRVGYTWERVATTMFIGFGGVGTGFGVLSTLAFGVIG
jgi:hypothetical protein